MRKGILLAGGSGSRLYPLTKVVNKHLLQVYDKPMIYYPLTTLMLADIRDIILITNKNFIESFKNLLGNGNRLGINIKYAIQDNPNGVAEALLISQDFIEGKPSLLILGDNIFYGNSLIKQLTQLSKSNSGATVLASPVSDPERYGIVELNKQGDILGIEEKPKNPKSNYALTGLYYYDESVIEKALKLKKSPRGELEITDINKQYLDENSLDVVLMGRGTTWLDTGTYDSLHDASCFIKTIQQRQGLIIGCPEEVAWRKGWISDSELEKLLLPLKDNTYRKYLAALL